MNLPLDRKQSNDAVAIACGKTRLALLMATLGLAAALPALAGAGQKSAGGGAGGSGGGSTSAQGTWTKVNAVAPEDTETAVLLTDGTLMVKSYDNYQHIFIYTPNGQDYINGTWKQVANAPIGMLYGPEDVLNDGRVFLAGGEYLSNSQDHNTCQVYNPVTNTWVQGPDGLFGDIGDTGNAMLTNGKILCSNRFDLRIQIFNPVTMTWTQVASMANFRGDEESWQILADGSVLDVMFVGQRYLPGPNEWIPTAPLPNVLVDGATEIGPAIALYDGRVITLGATPVTAIFMPPTTLNGTGSWVAGPAIPGGNGCPDTPGCVEPNGKVLFIMTPTDFAAPYFAEFDPVLNQMSTITGPPNTEGVPSFEPRFLNLPNGTILMTGWGHTMWVYTPLGGPQASWKAHINSPIVKSSATTYTLTGQQLNGLTYGGAYGDDADMSTNYPIVILTNASTHAQYFARSFNFSTMGIATGTANVTCQFTLPAGLPSGSYLVSTVANGVPSSNSVPLDPPVFPTAVQIYDGQGANAQGTVANLDAADGLDYSVSSVSTSVGAVAAAQITYQVGSSTAVGGLVDGIVATAPSGCTNYVYFLNVKTGVYDLVSTVNMNGAPVTIGAGPTTLSNYITAGGTVIVVDRAVYPVRFSSFQFQLKLDKAVMNG